MMTRPRLLAAFALLSLALRPPLAHGAIITFDDQGDVFWGTGQFTSGGYVVDSISGMMATIPNGNCSPQCAANGTVAVAMVRSAPQIVGLTPVSGTPFALSSFDGAETFSTLPNLWATNIVVTGFLLGGGTVSASFALDFVNDGRGSAVDFQRFTLPATFTNLTSVQFSGAGGTFMQFSIDNVEVSDVASVPEPAVMLLFGLGLVGVGARCRRRRG